MLFFSYAYMQLDFFLKPVKLPLLTLRKNAGSRHFSISFFLKTQAI